MQNLSSLSSGTNRFQVERDWKCHKLPQGSFDQQKLEILIALKKLGDPLSPAELDFLSSNANEAMGQFESAAQKLSE